MIFIACIRTATRALGELLGDNTLGSSECGFAIVRNGRFMLALNLNTLLTPHLSAIFEVQEWEIV